MPSKINQLVNQLLCDVLVVVDAGLSGSKNIWMPWPVGKAELMMMGPELLEVQSSSLLDFGLSGGAPEDNAVVILKDGRQLAFGEKAREMRGKPPAGFSKYEPTTYKILAVVGSIAKSLNLPADFNLALGAVLPYSEYQDNEHFKELLHEHLASFTFLGQEYRVSLNLLDIKPEGAGVGLMRKEEDGARFESINTAVLMMGERDISVLPFKKGKPQSGNGTQLGFRHFLASVQLKAALNLTSDNEALLSKLVFRGQSEPRCIERIAKMVVSSHEHNHKVAQINQAIEVCKAKYWQDLIDWLEDSLGQSLFELDEVIVSGGTALYLRPELESFFGQEKISIRWGANLEKQMGSALRREVEPVLSFRLADAFGLFKLLVGKVKNAATLAAPTQISDK